MRLRVAVIQMVCAADKLAKAGGGPERTVRFNGGAVSQGPVCTNLLAEELDPFCLSMGRRLAPQRLRSGREAATGCLSQDHERVLAQSEEAQ
jgi:hypothetical protein